MNFKAQRVDTYETVFDAYENGEVVDERFNIIHDQEAYEINKIRTGVSNFRIGNKEFIYSVPVIVVQHFDDEEDNLLQVVLNIGNASVNKPFEDGKYRNLGTGKMLQYNNSLIKKMEDITKVKPSIGCSTTYCYCYSKPWSMKEWKRIVEAIERLSIT